MYPNLKMSCSEAGTILRCMIEDRIPRRYSNSNPELHDRIEMELRVITEQCLALHFLVFNALVETVRAQEIRLMPGCGTVPSSVIAFILGITDVNPLKYGLFFERFYNPIRMTAPSIIIEVEEGCRDSLYKTVLEAYEPAMLTLCHRRQGREFEEPYLELHSMFSGTIEIQILESAILNEIPLVTFLAEDSLGDDRVPLEGFSELLIASPWFGGNYLNIAINEIKITKFDDLLLAVTFGFTMNEGYDYLDGLFKKVCVGMRITDIDSTANVGDDLAYPHNNTSSLPCISQIVAPTGGVFVFQEQIMQAFHDIYGFTFGESDIAWRTLRRNEANKIMALEAICRKASKCRDLKIEDHEALFRKLATAAKVSMPKAHFVGKALLILRYVIYKAQARGQ
ncbi:hypothetical protein MASR2M29_02650 [Spirochaetota bacterium]